MKWSYIDRGKPRYWERNCPSATFCTSRPALNNLSENPHFRYNKPAELRRDQKWRISRDRKWTILSGKMKKKREEGQFKDLLYLDSGPR
jgi:hypothetical protein